MKTKKGMLRLLIGLCFVCSVGEFFIFDYFQFDMFLHIGSQAILCLIMILGFLSLNRKRKIEKVVFEIQNIPRDINPCDYQQIDSARNKYDALSLRLRRKVYNYADLKKAEEIREEQKEVDLIIYEIDNIPQCIKFTDCGIVESVRNRYNKLSLWSRNKISNYSLLIEAEQIRDIVLKISMLNSLNVQQLHKKAEQVRNQYNRLTSKEQSRVDNISVLDAIEKEIEELSEMEDVIVEIKNIPQDITPSDYHQINFARAKYDALPPRLREKVYNYSDLKNAEEARKIVSKIEVLEEQDFALVETSVQDFHIQYVPDDIWQRVGNKFMLESIEKLIQQKKEFPSIQEKATPFRNMCTAIELQNIDKLADEYEKIMRQMTIYCEKSTKTSIEKYGEDFLDCSNYFNNYYLDYLPKNRYSLRFCCSVGNYYYNKIHNNKAAYRWFAVAKGIFEYQEWDFSEYATEASNMYKVIADMTVSNPDEKFLHYLASFLCDTGNKEVYQYLKKYDSDNKDMYTQYMNKTHPLNWGRIEIIWNIFLDRISKTAEVANNVGNAMQSVKSGLPDLNALSQFRKDRFELRCNREKWEQEQKDRLRQMHNQ